MKRWTIETVEEEKIPLLERMANKQMRELLGDVLYYLPIPASQHNFFPTSKPAHRQTSFLANPIFFLQNHHFLCYTKPMIHLEKQDYPEDFYYHRTASPVYRRYLESCGPETYTLGKGPQYGWKKNLLGFHIIKQERTDHEPDIEALKSSGVRHAFVAWIPDRRTDIPHGWRKLWLSDHFQETGITTLDENYRKKWNERARRAEKKFLAS